MLLNEKLPDQVKEFSVENCPNGNLAKVAKFIQTLIIFWPVYPIYTNSLFLVIFVELPFCHFPPPNTSIRGKDSKKYSWPFIWISFFQTNGKQPYSFPVLSRFCNGLWEALSQRVLFRYFYQSNKVLEKVFKLKFVRLGVQSNEPLSSRKSLFRNMVLGLLFRSLLWRGLGFVLTYLNSGEN